MRALALAVLVVTMTTTAAAAIEPTEESAFVPSEQLLELLDAKNDEGEPMISAQERAYFDELPRRAKELFETALESELMTEGEHLQALLALDLRPQALELLMEDNCIVCHADPWQDPAVMFSSDPEANGSPPHMNLDDFINDVHFQRGLSCAGCHGGDPLDTVMTDPTYESMPKAPLRHEDRTWIPEFCARCHADPALMRRFNPDLPTDQYAKYRESRHGQKLLGEGDSKAAQCVSCHSAHGIRRPRSPRSTVYAKNVPGTCGACHADAEYMKGYVGRDGEPLPTDQLEDYRTSVHGRALLEKGDIGAPACNDCHGSHAAMPPEVSSVAQVCRTCHTGNGELFDGSRHKKAFDRNNWPECGKCHGNHAVAKPDDSMLSEEDNALCFDCHSRFAKHNEKCQRTARYFHTVITSLNRDTDDLDGRIAHLAERGLDVEPIGATVEQLHDILRQARSRIHAFDRDEFAPVEKEGQSTLEAGWKLVADAEAEYRFRRNGLIISVGIMVFLAVLLWLKIREIDARE
jgi:predicted CXXCH cytochrome family protein